MMEDKGHQTLGHETIRQDRALVFASIRRSLAVRGDEILRREAVAARLTEAPVGVLPARTSDAASRLAVMQEKLEAAQASWAPLPRIEDLPQAVAAYLEAKGLPPVLRGSLDPRFQTLQWEGLELSFGRSDGGDKVGLTFAEVGMAETGTLALVSGKEQPSSLNFLPDHHLVVLKQSDILGVYEELWPRIRQKYGNGAMPRTLNFITGPSRSGDIEQTILLGAHGPRSLHVWIWQE